MICDVASTDVLTGTRTASGLEEDVVVPSCMVHDKVPPNDRWRHTPSDTVNPRAYHAY